MNGAAIAAVEVVRKRRRVVVFMNLRFEIYWTVQLRRRSAAIFTASSPAISKVVGPSKPCERSSMAMSSTPTMPSHERERLDERETANFHGAGMVVRITVWRAQ